MCCLPGCSNLLLSLLALQRGSCIALLSLRCPLLQALRLLLPSRHRTSQHLELLPLRCHLSCSNGSI